MAASGYTIFMTYILIPESLTALGCGNSSYIHCNYINKFRWLSQGGHTRSHLEHGS